MPWNSWSPTLSTSNWKPTPTSSKCSSTAAARSRWVRLRTGTESEFTRLSHDHSRRRAQESHPERDSRAPCKSPGAVTNASTAPASATSQYRHPLNTPVISVYSRHRLTARLFRRAQKPWSWPSEWLRFDTPSGLLRHLELARIRRSLIVCRQVFRASGAVRRRSKTVDLTVGPDLPHRRFDTPSGLLRHLELARIRRSGRCPWQRADSTVTRRPRRSNTGCLPSRRATPLHDLITDHMLAAGGCTVTIPPCPVLTKGETDIARAWVYVRDDRPFGGPDPSA